MAFHIGARKRNLFIATLAITSVAWLPAGAEDMGPRSGSGQYQASSAEDGLRSLAMALNEERSAAFRRRDTAAVAQIFTPDAVYVELLPRLEVMRGRAEIKAHFDALLAAQTSNLKYTATSAEATGKDAMSVGGDYVLTAGTNRQIQGHFFQILQRDGSGWKIAMQVFARPEPVTVGEVDNYRGN